MITKIADVFVQDSADKKKLIDKLKAVGYTIVADSNDEETLFICVEVGD